MQLVKLMRLSVGVVKPEEFDRICMLGGLYGDIDNDIDNDV